MSSRTSARLSTTSSLTDKNFLPPRPTYNSPKLHSEPLSPPARPRLLSSATEFGTIPKLPNDMSRSRSSTVGSYLPPIDDFPHTPNPIKSQFEDDSEDEERLQPQHGSTRTRARLAAIGTASRLFKGRRHSRTPSSSQDSVAPLNIVKNYIGVRPGTSDGLVTPSPRQAIFGGRPSPSELHLDRDGGAAKADLELMAGLMGGPVKPRLKAVERKSLTKREHRREHSNAAPPPYEEDSQGGLRKVSSLASLRLDMRRGQEGRSNSVERSAWDPMLAESSGSAGSCDGGSQAKVSQESSPSKKGGKKVLPPQKPPPRSCLPLPPPPPLPQAQEQRSSHESSLNSEPLSPKSVEHAQARTHDSSPGMPLSSLIDEHSSKPSPTLPNDTRIKLNVGGTTFVTLLDTLKGASEDSPRLLNLLQHQLEPSPISRGALCRRKRVDASSHRRNRSGSDGSHNHLPTSHSGSSNSSLNTSESQQVSDTSTKRTSDLSDASSGWSKEEQELPPLTSAALPSSRLGSPQAYRPSPIPKQAESVFLDRNAETYRDIFDILRTQRLPYRLQAASIALPSQASSSCGGDGRCSTALKLDLRCKLHSVKDEAEWLGYNSIVTLCEHEISLLL